MATYTLTIDHTKVSANLTNFPIYVNLNDVISGMTLAQAQSVRVYKADGTTELPREIVSASEMHFLADSLSSTTDTTFTLDIDGTSSDYAVTDTYGAQNVWTDDYKAVFHFQDSIVDSTSNQATITTYGSPSVSGGIASFDGVDDAFSFPVTWQLNHTVFDVYFKINHRENSGRDYIFMHNGIQFFTDIGQTRNWFNLGSSSGLTYWSPTLPLNEWHSFNAQVDLSKTVREDQEDVYMDGSHVNIINASSAITPTTLTSDTFYVCRNSTGYSGYYNQSDFTELRLSSVARSTEWIATEYNNQSSASTFYSVIEKHPIITGASSITGISEITL